MAEIRMRDPIVFNYSEEKLNHNTQKKLRAASRSRCNITPWGEGKLHLELVISEGFAAPDILRISAITDEFLQTSPACCHFIHQRPLR